ncbi:MAG: hypothetical protein IJ710_07320 [Prevotella sp.]|nr:hypothetical protein [Prevotella sp.]
MQKLTLEYELQARSPQIPWTMISEAGSLQKWIADTVTADGDQWTFTWGQPWTERDTKTATVVEAVKHSHIRLRWDYQEEDPDAYWEMRIEQSELTGHLNLLITDYADAEDIDDLRDLWDSNLERLHRVSGL